MKKCKEHHPPQHIFLTCLSLLCLLIKTVEAKSPPPFHRTTYQTTVSSGYQHILFIANRLRITECSKSKTQANDDKASFELSKFSSEGNKTKFMNYSSLNLKAISFVLYPSVSVPSKWLVPRVLSNSSARIERNGRLVEEDLRNEVEAKYTFLNWPIDIDACLHRSFDTQVDLAFNEFFSPFNPFNHILLVLFYLYNQLKY